MAIHLGTLKVQIGMEGRLEGGICPYLPNFDPHVSLKDQHGNFDYKSIHLNHLELEFTL